MQKIRVQRAKVSGRALVVRSVLLATWMMLTQVWMMD